MQNRFVEVNQMLKRSTGLMPPPRPVRAMSVRWSGQMAAADRVLVILIENKGVDLGIPEVVDKLLDAVPGASMIPDSLRGQLVDGVRDTLKKVTDNLLESAELALNRYNAAKPELFGDVIVLRDGTATYNDLKSTLLAQSRDGKIIDLIILTHGGQDAIDVAGDVNGEKIIAIKNDLGAPLSIRSVYMMNCVGASLNQAWLKAGARVSAGSIRNNYLPEPTTFFFWKAWKEGKAFDEAVTSAYRKTINLINDTVRNIVSAAGPVAGLLADQIDISQLDFVKDSAPVVEGQHALTIASDQLAAPQSLPSGLATTVLPLSFVRSLSEGSAIAQLTGTVQPLSPDGLEFIKKWEGFRDKPGNDDAGQCVVGYGTFLHSGACDGRLIEEPHQAGVARDRATELLHDECADLQMVLKDAVKTALNQPQSDALISFVHNIGAKAFMGSTLLKLLNDKDLPGAANDIRKWTKAKRGDAVVELPELQKRRQAEAELFEKQVPVALGESMSMRNGHGHAKRRLVRGGRYRYESQSLVMSTSRFSYQQTPLLILGLEVKDAISIGLAGASIVQSQVNASQGSFGLTYDTAQRLLVPEARSQMPGAQTAKQKYTTQLMYLGSSKLNAAEANVIVEWEGNPYGEIGTPVIRRDLKTSTEWTKSSATITIKKIERIPAPTSTDPRAWPIVYTYEGTYDPWGNGYFEFSGEFELNAFGGLYFNRHEVVSRAAVDFLVFGSPEQYVQRGANVIVETPVIPQDQVDYLKSKLP